MAQFDSNFHHITEGIRAVASPADATDLLNTIVESYGLGTAAFLTVRPVYEEPSKPFYVTTYSPDWVKRYIEKDFFDIDPVLSYGLRAVTLVDWKEIDLSDKPVRTFFGEAREHGVGKHGVTFPVRGVDGDRGILSVTSNENAAAWQAFLKSHVRDFQHLAGEFHHAIGRIQGRPRYQTVCSDREIECLKWYARGEKVKRTAEILSLSPRTVRFHLDLARAKLGAKSLAHAVAIAAERGLFFQRRF